MSMEVIRAEFVINTPMFLGEADGECATLIRPPSIKGALRFWWRAMNWARVRKHCGSDQEALAQLHQEEGLMFGESADTAAGTGGQGCFLLRVHQQQGLRVVGEEKNFAARSPQLQYLLGMGLCHFRNGLLRDYLEAGGTFVVELALKPGIKDGQRQQLLDTLMCFGLLGCLGSRARKGFGSVSITRLIQAKGGSEQALALPTDALSYKAEIKRLLGDCFKTDLGDAPLTAFSAKTRMQIGKHGRDALALLGEHGFEMGMYRGYGNSGKTFGRDAEQKFQFDHNWAYDVANGTRKADLPKRAVFGLPHPYFLSGIKKNVAVDVDLAGTSVRRASPLFAHVHAFPDGDDFLLVQTLLRGLFLPSAASVKVKGEARFDISGSAASSGAAWKVIETFMDRFTSKDVIHG